MKTPLYLALVIIALIPAMVRDIGQWQLTESARSFRSGDLNGAIAGWSSSIAPWGKREIPTYNRGTAHFRMGNYSAASRDFRSAALSNDTALRQQALYNLGTVQLTAASKLEDSNRTEAVRMLADAARNLKEATRINPDDNDAKHNLAIADNRLSALQPAPAQTPKAAPSPQPTPPEKGSPDSAKPGALSKPGNKPGTSTDTDMSGGTKRKSNAMTRDQALKLLDDAKGRETLRSSVAPGQKNGHLSVPEKDW
jgi:tetratricopeptide (TPR) repeat protein